MSSWRGRTRGGVTAGSRASSWAARQARNLLMDLGERAGRFKFLLRDREGKFTAVFDEVFGGNSTRVIKTPVRSPRANSCAERFVGTLRRECLDHLLLFGEQHLRKVLAESARHYNGHRPHQSLHQRPPQHQPGKTALLDYAASQALGFRVVRAWGVESEMELAFAGLHQLCAPLLDRLQHLPRPQRDALQVAFGLREGDARLRCGAGGIRSRFSTRRTVDAPTRYPRPSSSPWIRL